MKKILSMALVLVMLMASLTVVASAEEEVIKLRWAMGSGGPAPIDNALVLEELNRMSREKIGVEMEIEYLSNDQFSLANNSGEVYDLYFTCSWMNNTTENISNGMFADVAPYIQEMAPGLYASMTQDVWDLATDVEGHIYAIPVKKDYAIENFITYPADVAAELGFEIPAVIEKWDELTPFLVAWKETMNDNEYPVLIGGAPNGADSSFDYINRTALIGCQFGTTDVCTVFDDPDVMERYATMAKWMELGLVNPDAAQIEETAVDSKALRINFAQAWDGYDYSVSNGYNTAMTRFNGPNINVDGVQGSMNALSATLEEDLPKMEAALKYLELLHTDKLFNDTMRYGVKGVHWDYVTEEQSADCAGGVLRTQQGIDNYSPWGFSQPAYFFASIAVSQEQIDGTAKAPVMDQYDQYYANVASSAKVSAMGGFTWDSSEWSNQLAEISAIKDEYWSDFVCGVRGWDVIGEEFMGKLNDAGLQDIVADAQAQLDEYLANAAQ